jgi:hypothetical protein
MRAMRTERGGFGIDDSTMRAALSTAAADTV